MYLIWQRLGWGFWPISDMNLAAKIRKHSSHACACNTHMHVYFPRRCLWWPWPTTPAINYFGRSCSWGLAPSFKPKNSWLKSFCSQASVNEKMGDLQACLKEARQLAHVLLTNLYEHIFIRTNPYTSVYIFLLAVGGLRIHPRDCPRWSGNWEATALITGQGISAGLWNLLWTGLGQKKHLLCSSFFSNKIQMLHCYFSKC